MSNSSELELKAVLEAARAKRAAFVFVGHPLRRDDGLGPWLARRCRPEGENARVFDAGDRLDALAEDIISFKPEHIVFIDAAEFGAKPGEIKVFNPLGLRSGVALSTHGIPLPAMAALIESETGAQVKLVGVQLEDKGFGEGFSPPVAAAAEKILALLNSSLK